MPLSWLARNPCVRCTKEKLVEGQRTDIPILAIFFLFGETGLTYVKQSEDNMRPHINKVMNYYRVWKSCT